MESRRSGRVAAYSFLFGNAVSMVGNALVIVALPWFVIETTGSAARTGVVGMVATLPALIAGMFGGVLVDRLGGRRMSVIADVISGLSVAMIPLLHRTVGLGYWTLVLLVFAGAALDIPGVTAKRLLLPDLARNADIRDEALTSAYETTEGASWIVGPLVAGALITSIGTVNLLWITAGGFLVSALCIGLFAPNARHVPEAQASGVGALAQMMDGFRYLRADSLLLALAFGLTLMNFLNTPFWGVVLPVRIEATVGSASRFALLLTTLGIGSLLGGIAYGAWGHRFRSRRRLLYLVAVSSFPIMLWVYVIQPPLPVVVLATLIAGILSGPINPLLVTVRLERIPPALRGRVFATFSGLAGAAIPIGMLFSGWMLEIAGVEAGLVIFAVLATVFALSLWLASPLRSMDEDAVAVTNADHGPA